MATETRFDKYLLLELLGRGGMGEVWKAVDPRFPERAVAIKVVQPGADRGFQEALASEARTLLSIPHHPNMVILYDVLELPERLGLVMELIPGLTLGELLLQYPGGLPWAMAHEVLKGLFAGVGHAHRHQVIHRDLKPDNVRLARPGAAGLRAEDLKILDFGLARIAKPFGTLFTRGAAGTLTYMSPEQIQEQPQGPYTDVYALGAITYELLAGLPPFSGPGHATFSAMIEAQCAEAPPPLYRPGVSGPLEQAIRQALAKAPRDRFPDAEAMGQAILPLVAALAQSPAHLPGPTMAMRAQTQSSLGQPAMPASPNPADQPPPPVRPNPAGQPQPSAWSQTQALPLSAGQASSPVRPPAAEHSTPPPRPLSAGQTSSSARPPATEHSTPPPRPFSTEPASTSARPPATDQPTPPARPKSNEPASSSARPPATDDPTPPARSKSAEPAVSPARSYRALAAGLVAAALLGGGALAFKSRQDSRRQEALTAAKVPEVIALKGGHYTALDGALHPVAPFALGRTHVTVEQFRAFVRATGHDAGDAWDQAGKDQHPVTYVNYQDAQAYAHWLSTLTGAAWYLPSEGEYQFAASNGGQAVAYPWGNEVPSRPGMLANSGKEPGDPATTEPVDRYPASPLGFRDLIGNAYIWTSTASAKGQRVHGGSWMDAPGKVTITHFVTLAPGERSDLVGFRVARP